jgi:hypothetical protein
MVRRNGRLLNSNAQFRTVEGNAGDTDGQVCEDAKRLAGWGTGGRRGNSEVDLIETNLTRTQTSKNQIRRRWVIKGRLGTGVDGKVENNLN